MSGAAPIRGGICVLTVPALTTSRSAISAFDSPRASSSSTSRSRSVRPSSTGAGGLGDGERRTNSSITERVTAGAISASPRATTSIAASSSSGGASLSMKPLAPARRASYT